MKKQTRKKSTENGFTAIKTGYARAALLLLACNLCLTAYAFVRLNEYSDARISAVTASSTSEEVSTTD